MEQEFFCLFPGQGPVGMVSDAWLGPGLHTTPVEALPVPPGTHGSRHMGGLEESSVGYECVI